MDLEELNTYKQFNSNYLRKLPKPTLLAVAISSIKARTLYCLHNILAKTVSKTPSIVFFFLSIANRLFVSNFWRKKKKRRNYEFLPCCIKWPFQLLCCALFSILCSYYCTLLEVASVTLYHPFFSWNPVSENSISSFFKV